MSTPRKKPEVVVRMKRAEVFKAMSFMEANRQTMEDMPFEEAVSKMAAAGHTTVTVQSYGNMRADLEWRKLRNRKSDKVHPVDLLERRQSALEARIDRIEQELGLREAPPAAAPGA